jgi:hypothetical protein
MAQGSTEERASGGFALHRIRGGVDIHLLSYPKAGRTWLRALIGKAIADTYGLPEHLLLETPELTRAAGLPIAAFDHDQSSMRNGLRWQDMTADRSAYRGKRVLLMGRDVRDILVSAYFQATRRIHVFAGPISAFIRHDVYGVEKILAFYRIWAANRHIPAQFEFLTYEDLHRDPVAAVSRVLALIGAETSDAVIANAVDFCRFENMHIAEAENHFKSNILRPAQSGDQESFKVRVGKVGNYAQYLSPNDIEYIDCAIASGGCEFTRPAAQL